MSLLLQQWKLDKEHWQGSEWAGRVKDHAKDFMVRALNSANHRDHRYMQNWLDNREDKYTRFKNLNIKAKALGKGLAIIFAIKDYSYDEVTTAIEMVNSFHVIRARSDLLTVLENKFPDNSFYQCEDCGEILEREDDRLHFAYDENPICQSCIDSNYIWSEAHEMYVRDDDERFFPNDEDDDSLIHSYHDSNPRHIPSEYDNRKPKVLLGLELEVEINEDIERNEKAEEVLSAIGIYRTDNNRYQYAELEKDGSLSYGFEIVTGFTGLDVHRKQLEFFKDQWQGVRSHNTRTCGLHVHVCKSNMSLYHAAKLVFFINDEKNYPLIRALARRNSDYGKLKDKKSNVVWIKNARESRNPLTNLNSDRYEALNFQNPKTIEFRLFKGTLKYETINACLEFSFLSWHFSKDASIKDLTIEKFLEFISKPENRADSVYLRDYLDQKGFSVYKKPLIKNIPIVINPKSSFNTLTA